MPRLATYHHAEGTSVGLVVEDRLIDLVDAGRAALGRDPFAGVRGHGADLAQLLAMPDLDGVLRATLTGVDAERMSTGLPLHGEGDRRMGAILCAPIPSPGKILGVGLNYASHADEASRELPEYPMLFAKFSNTVSGPFDAIPIPRVSHRIDYEGELAVVIGRRGRYVPEDDAMQIVAGYMVANDVSARDYQVRTREMLSGKTFDGFAPMGPWLVTRDELPDLTSLRLRTWVNGDLRQSATLGEMLFSVPRLVAYASDIMTLEPGDVILTGTPAGIGATMEPRRWLRPGDDVRIEIDGIGAIHNRVAAEAADA
jgi:acylpyruvate hydrolase